MYCAGTPTQTYKAQDSLEKLVAFMPAHTDLKEKSRLECDYLFWLVLLLTIDRSGEGNADKNELKLAVFLFKKS